MNFNSNEACESFINMCDELMIPAEESLSLINDTINLYKKKADIIKVKIKRADGNIPEQKKLLKELLTLNKDFEQKIKNADDNIFAKTSSFLKKISGYLLVCVGICSVFFGGFLAIMAGGILISDNPEDNRKVVLIKFHDINEKIQYLIDHIEDLQTDQKISNEGFIDNYKKHKEVKKEIKKVNKEIKSLSGTRRKFKEDVTSANEYMDETKKKLIIKNNSELVSNINKIINYINSEAITHNYLIKVTRPELYEYDDEDKLEIYGCVAINYEDVEDDYNLKVILQDAITKFSSILKKNKIHIVLDDTNDTEYVFYKVYSNNIR